MTRQDMSQTPEVTAFFDEASNTFSYVVKDPESAACAVSGLDAAGDGFDLGLGLFDLSLAFAHLCFKIGHMPPYIP